MLFLSIYFYIIFFSYYQFSDIFIDAFPLVYYSDSNFNTNLEIFYSFYINFFYILYVLVIVVLLVVEGRRIKS